MGKREKKKAPVIVVDRAIEALAEAVVDHLQRKASQQEDPFDMYTRSKRANVYLDIYNFKERFTRGYEVLLRELSQGEK